MPRTSTSESLSYKAIRGQALAALNELRKQIRTLEAELRELRTQEQQLNALFGRPAPSGGMSPHRRASGRVDWLAVLKRLPREFKAQDVRKFVGDKRPSEIFAAITRWQQAKLVKRKERGVYQRVDS